MSIAFAAAEARLGKSCLARLGNASLRLAGGAVVDGMLDNNGRSAAVGMGMDARQIEFACDISAAANLVERDMVTLTYRGVASVYLIAARLPDDVHLQHAVFALRKAN